MKLTFGKFKGTEVESLKRTAEGQDYLAWGANNLSNITWRNEFKRVLSTVTEHDEAVAIASNDEIGYSEALTYVRDMKAQEAAEDAMIADCKANVAQVVREWSLESGRTIGQIEAIVRRYEYDNPEEIPANMFSSSAARQTFIRRMNQIQACWK